MPALIACCSGGKYRTISFPVPSVLQNSNAGHDPNGSCFTNPLLYCMPMPQCIMIVTGVIGFLWLSFADKNGKVLVPNPNTREKKLLRIPRWGLRFLILIPSSNFEL